MFKTDTTVTITSFTRVGHIQADFIPDYSNDKYEETTSIFNDNRSVTLQTDGGELQLRDISKLVLINSDKNEMSISYHAEVPDGFLPEEAGKIMASFGFKPKD